MPTIGWQSDLHGKMNLYVKGLKLDQPVATADSHACRYRLLDSTDKPGCLVVPAGLIHRLTPCLINQAGLIRWLAPCLINPAEAIPAIY